LLAGGGMRATWLVAIGLVAACGSGGDDGDDGDDGETGVCRDKPCLTSIDDEADWAMVSVPHTGNRCDFVEETKYLAPATATAALQDVVFQDVEAHRFHLEFMTQVLPEIFGGLTPQMYQAIVQRRATRQYWAGALYRLRDASGATIGYGFDVIFDPADWNEQLTEEEVVAVATALEARFHLPLVYAPTDNEAIFSASSFTMVETHMPRACQHTACATPGVDCVVVPAAVQLCGHFVEGRTVQAEHAMKAQLAANPGTYDLPRGVGSYDVPAIFGAGVLGPTRTPITPVGGGRYQVQDVGGYLYRAYRQAFSVGARTLELTWDLWLAEGGGGFLLQEPWVGEMMAYADIVPQQSFDERLHLSSCLADNLEHWQIEGVMAGGDGFTIDFRYRYPFAGSGPLFVTRGRVTLGGQTATVDDYFSLVYAGEHHNWNNQYWVLFASPLTYNGHPVNGLWIDEQPYQFELEAAYTLDANQQPLDLLTVTSYEVAPVQ
jgi:hypothetical protein